MVKKNFGIQVHNPVNLLNEIILKQNHKEALDE